MADPSNDVETKSNVETSQEPIPHPANPETMLEKIDTSARDGQGTEELEKRQTNKSNMEPDYPKMSRVIPIALALYMSMFLVALVRLSHPPLSIDTDFRLQDRTIIATAIPRITDDFHSLGDVGWYGSAYMLTGCSFQLLMGRVYTFYNPKKVFISAIFVFEIGSAICGAAPNSVSFIIGRAIAGSGSSGIFSGAIIVIMNLVPLHKRPMFQGLFGVVFGISSVAGPLLGGVFTSDVSWRWCFYINLPIGGVAMVILLFILKIPAAAKAGTPIRQQLEQLDPIGTFFFITGVICLLLALQWGGSTYPWNDGRIIALLILFIVLISVFIVVQIWKQENATVPPRIVKNRSIIAGMWAQFCVGSSMLSMVYFIPIWFQAIKDVSAYKSGIDILPLLLSLVLSSITAGFLVGRIGYYTPFMIANSVILSIGAGLITTWTPTTGHSKWIGFQVVYGFGLGLGMQQATLAAQAVLARKDAPTGISLIMFCQMLGGAVFVSIGQNVFSNKLVKGLAGVANIDPAKVVATGATELRHVVNAADIQGVLQAYNGALVSVFQAALAMACLSIIGSLSMEWKSVKKVKKQGGPEAAEKGEMKGIGSEMSKGDEGMEKKETDSDTSKDGVVEDYEKKGDV